MLKSNLVTIYGDKITPSNLKKWVGKGRFHPQGCGWKTGADTPRYLKSGVYPLGAWMLCVEASSFWRLMSPKKLRDARGRTLNGLPCIISSKEMLGMGIGDKSYSEPFGVGYDGEAVWITERLSKSEWTTWYEETKESQ